MTAFVYNLATRIEAQVPTGSIQRACMTNSRKHVPHVAHFLTDAPSFCELRGSVNCFTLVAT